MFSSNFTSCGLTVLHTLGQILATKRFTLTPDGWNKVSYDKGKHFRPSEYEICNLRELSEVIEVLRLEPQAFIVRGQLTSDVRARLVTDPDYRIRRRKSFKNGIDPTLLEVPRHWIIIDIDGWPLRATDDLALDPGSAIEHAIRELLPPPFGLADYFWQLSSSAGFEAATLKAHIFFWLTAPASNEHVKAVLKQCAPGVDTAPFSAAQPIYTADPVVVGGPDPIPHRTGWKHAANRAVVLPTLVPVEPRKLPATRRKPDQAGANFGNRTASSGGSPSLDMLGDGPDGQGFHAPIRSATMRYARHCKDGGDRDDAQEIEGLRQAITAAPRRDGRDLSTYTSKQYLQGLIDGAFAVLAGQDSTAAIAPHHPAPTQTVDEARASLDEHVAGFFDRAYMYAMLDEEARKEASPEQAAVATAVGTGKSTSARQAVLRFLARSRMAGGRHRLNWLVPYHVLGDETLAEMIRMGINAAVMRGRQAFVPGSNETMCRDLEAIKDGIAIQADLESDVCGSGKLGKSQCQFRTGPERCAFQAQKAAVAEADVVIAAHQGLFNAGSKAAERDMALTVVDEAWWPAGLAMARHVNLHGFADEVGRYPVRRKDRSAKAGGKQSAMKELFDDRDTCQLYDICRRAEAGFAAHADGALASRSMMLNAGLTGDQCSRAATLEWHRMVTGVLTPGMSPEARRDAAIKGAGNAVIARRVAIWDALGALLDGEAEHTGRLQLGNFSSAAGTRRTIIVHARREISAHIQALPLLCLDGTLPLPIVRRFLPRIKLLANVNPKTPFATVYQVSGGFGISSLCMNKEIAEDDPENLRRAEKVRRLSDFVALHSGGDALVVTYQAIENGFRRPGVRTAHFGAVAGLDEYSQVKAVFIIGRPMPKSQELRAMALALSGLPVPEENAQIETRGLLMEDGSGAAFNVRSFADETLEALRAAITDTAVVQAAGRGRAVNRQAHNPLSVYLLCDVVTPMPVKNIFRWDDLAPDCMERMATHDLVLFSPKDAALIYPEWFPTEGAAEQAIRRAGELSPTFPCKTVLSGGCRPNQLKQVSYKPDGRGQQWRRALVAANHMAGLAASLSGKLGRPVQVKQGWPEPATEQVVAEPVLAVWEFDESDPDQEPDLPDDYVWTPKGVMPGGHMPA